MTFGWMIISSERVATLTRDMQREGTWAEFVADLGPHVAGEKMGRACVPYRADWSEGDSQPRAGAHKQPGARWRILCLDLDTLTDDQLEAAHLKLSLAGLAFVLHSTHSFDPKGHTKARLYVPTEQELTEAEVPEGKARLAAWLGLTNDKATAGGYSLFFTPRAPHEFIDDAFLLAPAGTPLDVSTLPAAPQAFKAFKRDAAPTAAAYREDWPEDIRNAAQAELDRACYRIREERTGHLRDLLRTNVRWVGGYIGAGLLRMEDALADLEEAVHERALHNPYDDKDAEERTQQVQDMLESGLLAPCVPRGFNPDNGEVVDVAKLRGFERLKYQLKAQAPERLYSVEEASAEMASFLRAPRPGHRAFVGLVEVSVGTGKTYQLRQLAAERALRDEYTVILSLDHGLLGQIRRDLEEQFGLGIARQLSGVNQPEAKTGNPQCIKAYDVDVQMLLRSGANVQASACRKCEHRKVCPALKATRRTLTEKIVLAPYDMAGRAIDMIMERRDSPGEPLIVCDEEPPGAVRVTVDDEQLALLTDHCGVWPCLREDQASIVKGMVRALQDGTHHVMAGEVLEKARSYYGQLHAPALSAWEERMYRDELAVVRDVLRMAGGWDGLERLKGEWTTLVPGRVWDTLRESGGFVLTATPNPRVYERAGIATELITLRVQDAPGTKASRTILYTSHGSRRGVGANKGGELQWDVIEADLKQLFELADRTKPNATILIGTFMCIALALKSTHAHLLEGRDVDVTYYEVARGRDDWKDRDVFASMYDPRPGGQDSFEEMSEAASRALEQFHGRARDPQPRAVGAMHVHFGTLAPISWYDAGADVEDTHTMLAKRPTGRPPARIPDDQVQLVEAFIQACRGNRKFAAHVADTSVASMRRYERGERALPPPLREKMRVRVDLGSAAE